MQVPLRRPRKDSCVASLTVRSSNCTFVQAPRSHDDQQFDRKRESAGKIARHSETRESWPSVRAPSEAIPFFQGEVAAENAGRFPNHQSELCHRILFVRRDLQTIRPIYEKLMASTGKRTVKTKNTQTPDEFAPLTRCPPAH